MPRPYSLDLRERVVSYVEAGRSRRAAAAHFSVSPSFVINLMTAFRERGAITPKRSAAGDTASSIRTASSSCPRVAEKDDISMPELASELQAASGVKADPASLSRWLIRKGLSFKKKPSGERRRIRPDVRQAREAWKAERQPQMRLEPHRLVFIDETGTILRQAQDEDDPRAGALQQGRAPSLGGSSRSLHPDDDPRYPAGRRIDRLGLDRRYLAESRRRRSGRCYFGLTPKVRQSVDRPARHGPQQAGKRACPQDACRGGVGEDGARSIEGVLPTGPTESGRACGGRRDREKAGGDDLACSDGRDRLRLCASGLHRHEATQSQAQGGPPCEYGKAGPGRHDWIKEIRE